MSGDRAGRDMRDEMKRVIWFTALVTGLMLLAWPVVSVIRNPLPVGRIVIASGGSGGLYDELAQTYRYANFILMKNNHQKNVWNLSSKLKIPSLRRPPSGSPTSICDRAAPARWRPQRDCRFLPSAPRSNESLKMRRPCSPYCLERDLQRMNVRDFPSEVIFYRRANYFARFATCIFLTPVWLVPLRQAQS